MATALATASASFRRTLVRLGLDAEHQALSDAVHFGRRAALLAAAEAVWGRHLGDLLGVKDVQTLLGVGTRQAVHDLVRRGRLLGLPTRDGRTLYPRFQLRSDGRPYPSLAPVLRAFSEAGADAWTVASWFATAQPELDGLTPADWLARGGDGDRVVAVARHSAAALAW